jgi:hypothetical protein
MDNLDLQSNHYRLDVHEEAKQVRIVMLHPTTRKVVCWCVLDTEDLYEMGSDLLRKYDKLMGLE